ncbi:MAG: hypothetical protein J2P53_04645 [Bradyrhizobiaceae bacterium]|nr:hypothetical protein [Bradyrhizobiaceae bacterium]
MNIVAAAFLLLMLVFDNAYAAGPYDGEWKGTATSANERCKRATLSFTVEGTVVLGQAKLEGDTTSINGAVDDRGGMGATIGFQFLTGRFTGDQFEGSFKFANCDWEATLRRSTDIGGRPSGVPDPDGDREAASSGRRRY